MIPGLTFDRVVGVLNYLSQAPSIRVTRFIADYGCFICTFICTATARHADPILPLLFCKKRQDRRRFTVQSFKAGINPDTVVG